MMYFGGGVESSSAEEQSVIAERIWYSGENKDLRVT